MNSETRKVDGELEFMESQYWEMYGIKKPHTGINSCPFIDLVYPKWKGVAHELGYCEALHFKVMMPKSVVESKCKTGAQCDYREAGIKKDEAIVREQKAKRRRRR